MQKSVSNLRYPCSSALKSCKLSCRAAHAVMPSEVETSTVPNNRGVDKSIVCRPLDYARGDKNAPETTSGGKAAERFRQAQPPIFFESAPHLCQSVFISVKTCKLSFALQKSEITNLLSHFVLHVHWQRPAPLPVVTSKLFTVEIKSQRNCIFASRNPEARIEFKSLASF